MKIIDILKDSAYSHDLFDSARVDALDSRIKRKTNKKGDIVAQKSLQNVTYGFVKQKGCQA